MFQDVDNSRRTCKHKPTATCGDGFLEFSSLEFEHTCEVEVEVEVEVEIEVLEEVLFSTVQQFSIIISAADNVQ